MGTGGVGEQPGQRGLERRGRTPGGRTPRQGRPRARAHAVPPTLEPRPVLALSAAPSPLLVVGVRGLERIGQSARLPLPPSQHDFRASPRCAQKTPRLPPGRSPGHSFGDTPPAFIWNHPEMASLSGLQAWIFPNGKFPGRPRSEWSSDLYPQGERVQVLHPERREEGRKGRGDQEHVGGKGHGLRAGGGHGGFGPGVPGGRAQTSYRIAG